MRAARTVLMIAILTFLLNPTGRAQNGIVIEPKDSLTAEILIDGKPFATWRAGGILNKVKLTKPILWPLLSPKGWPITRCYPLGDCGREEPVDHGHHQGIWLAYGKLAVGEKDTVDTWAVYRTLPGGPETSSRYRPGTRGWTVCRKWEILPDGASLYAESDWIVEGTQEAFLREKRYMTFSEGPGWRAIDFVIHLSALEKPVVFLDSKEGFLALRVGPDLMEIRGNDPELAGKEPGHGIYLNAAGQKTEQNVWGKRSPWVALFGVLQSGEPITIVFMDHPDNLNHPSPWMARGYGLFAINPFGLADFTGRKQRMDLRLPAGGSVTFKYRLLFAFTHLDSREIQRQFRTYAGR